MKTLLIILLLAITNFAQIKKPDFEVFAQDSNGFIYLMDKSTIDKGNGLAAFSLSNPVDPKNRDKFPIAFYRYFANCQTFEYTAAYKAEVIEGKLVLEVAITTPISKAEKGTIGYLAIEAICKKEKELVG